MVIANELLEAQASKWQPGAQQLIDISKRSVDKITRLVDGILTYSKLDGKHNKVEAIELNHFLIS